jgi:DNA-directed RNA polymerase beta' subunit
LRLDFINLNHAVNLETLLVNPEPFHKKTKEPTEDGIFSETIFGNNLEEVVYHCKCKNLSGKFYDKSVCPVCETEVKAREKEFITGWIQLNCKVINPLYYIFLTKIIPKNHLLKIIEGNSKVDSDGNVIIDPELEKADGRYFQKGLDFLIENLWEVLDFYAQKKRSQTKEIYEFLRSHQEYIVIEYFPVIPPSLRPAMLVSDKLIFDEINNPYNQMIKSANSLASMNAKLAISRNDIRNTITEQLQILANEVFDKIIEKLSGKNGLIRNNLLGSRFNFTSRMIIVPDNKCTIDEVSIPYLTFMELYKFEIINMIGKLKQTNYMNVYNIWHEALLHRNTLIDTIIDEFEKREHFLIFGRNPTINLGSILLMKINRVKRDIEDLTLGVPIDILGLIAGDFDGK